MSFDDHAQVGEFPLFDFANKTVDEVVVRLLVGLTIKIVFEDLQKLSIRMRVKKRVYVSVCLHVAKPQIAQHRFYYLL